MSSKESSQKKTPQSRTSSTASKKQAKNVTEEELGEAAGLLSRALEVILRQEKRLQKEDEFDEPIDTADDDDVRMYWKVKMVRGADEVMTSLEGSSMMSNLLDPKMKGHAPSQIQNEVLTKISLPLSAKFMKLAEELSELRKATLESRAETHEDERGNVSQNILGAAAEATSEDAAAGEPQFAPVEYEAEPKSASKVPAIIEDE